LEPDVARREIYVDDIDGKEHESVQARRYSIGHQAYTIDLSDKNYEQFLKDMEKYTSKSVKVSGAPSAPGRVRAARGTRTQAGPSQSAQIRSWAASQGIEVAPRGRIHADVVAKWEAAGKP
jgi:hypothetical protein